MDQYYLDIIQLKTLTIRMKKVTVNEKIENEKDWNKLFMTTTFSNFANLTTILVLID